MNTPTRAPTQPVTGPTRVNTRRIRQRFTNTEQTIPFPMIMGNQPHVDRRTNASYDNKRTRSNANMKKHSRTQGGSRRRRHTRRHRRK